MHRKRTIAMLTVQMNQPSHQFIQSRLQWHSVALYDLNDDAKELSVLIFL